MKKIQIYSSLVILTSILWIIGFVLIGIKTKEFVMGFMQGPRQDQALTYTFFIIGVICLLFVIKCFGAFLLIQKNRKGYLTYLIPNLLLTLFFILTVLYLLFGLPVQIPSEFYFDMRMLIVEAFWIGSFIFMYLIGKEVKRI